MYISEDVHHYDSRLGELVRQSLDIQESVKSDIAEMRQTMEDIVSNEVKKATKCMEEKLDALLVKLREQDNWKHLRATTTALLIPAVLKMLIRWYSVKKYQKTQTFRVNDPSSVWEKTVVLKMDHL